MNIPIKYRKFQSLENYVTYSMWLGLSGLVKRVNKVNYFTPDSLRAFILSQPDAQTIWQNFVNSNWNTKFAPCLDRIAPTDDFGPETTQLTTNWLSKLKHAINPHEVENDSTGVRGVCYQPTAINKQKKFLVRIPTTGGKLFNFSTKWFKTVEEAQAYRTLYDEKLKDFLTLNNVKFKTIKETI
jgi:hypothetical protein